MAEIGHPVIGPQSLQKLTPAEIRIYAEGLQYRNDKQQEQSDSGPSYNQSTKRSRDEKALERVSRKARERDQ